jgi:TonB family protein
MKKQLYLLSFLILFFISNAFAQSENDNCPPLYTHSTIYIPKIIITKIVIQDSSKYSKLPQIVTNLDSLTELLVYPEIAKRAGVQGEIVIQINLDGNGKIVNRKFIKTIGAACDEAALDALRKSKFYPARIGNEKVNSEINFWFNFNLTVIVDEPDILLSEIIYEDNSLFNYKKMKLDNLGNASYIELDKTADAGNEIQTEIKGTFSTDIFERLSEFILSQCFLNFEQSYSPSFSPHSRWETITVRSDSIQKRVSSSGGGDPVGLWAIIYILRNIQDEIKWEEVKDE